MLGESEKMKDDLKGDLENAFQTLSGSVDAASQSLEGKIIEEARKGEMANAKTNSEIALQVLQGTRIALNLPLLDIFSKEDFEFERQAKLAQNAHLAKKRKREHVMLAEEFMAMQRKEQDNDPDFEYWSDDSKSIILNAWVNHGQICKNIDRIYPAEEWIKHLERNSLRDLIFKENLVLKDNPKRIPSKYIPKPFFYFKRQENKKKVAELKTVAAKGKEAADVNKAESSKKRKT